MEALFADDAELGSVAAVHRFQGKKGARDYWRMYCDNFAHIESEFRNLIETDGRAALRWVSRGETRSGEDFSYEGVTLLEFDGAGRVRRHLRTVTDTSYASLRYGS